MSWIIEFEKLYKYEKPVKLEECSDIRTSTSRKPLSEWSITGFIPIKPSDVHRVIEAIRSKATPPSPPPLADGVPSHDVLVKELLELGEWLGFVIRKEVWTPDKVYRLDVIWMKSSDRPPIKAFEAELGRDVGKALARLKHAYDKWNCQQLWLVVSDESDAERARRLVEPKLRGAFEEIKDRVRILSWKELHELYKYLEPYKDILKDLMQK
uniref:Uncharacterized protein n=1 Tax=Ignisphaera aggregans TaxID=334771 RepID=A0A7J2TAJ7_9CREN